MRISLLYFAALKEAFGTSEEEFRSEDERLSIFSLRGRLAGRRPGIALESVRVAVNEEFVTNEHLVEDGDVVAFLPPVSGG